MSHESGVPGNVTLAKAYKFLASRLQGCIALQVQDRTLQGSRRDFGQLHGFPPKIKKEYSFGSTRSHG